MFALVEYSQDDKTVTVRTFPTKLGAINVAVDDARNNNYFEENFTEEDLITALNGPIGGYEDGDTVIRIVPVAQ